MPLTAAYSVSAKAVPMLVGYSLSYSLGYLISCSIGYSTDHPTYHLSTPRINSLSKHQKLRL